MKKISIFLIIISIIFLSSCSGETPKKDHNGINNITSNINNTKIIYNIIKADWHEYSNADELINAADTVFTAKITDISFDILDARNDMPISSDTDVKNMDIKTLYKIEVDLIYKGDLSGITHFKVPGGLKNYKTQEQVQLMRKNGMLEKENVIPIYTDSYGNGYDLEVGKTYLFVMTKSYNRSLLSILNMNQSVFDLSDPTSIQGYNGSKISPQEIIAKFDTEAIKTVTEID